ncbi:transposase [Castellaniella sp.]|uniref:transposase n=1 Tax=Castellaniella sp. TaxID=1955812 RepID=UPI0035652FAE
MQALYFAKQKLNGFLTLKAIKAKRVQQLLPEFLVLIRQSGQSPAKTLAATLTSWLEPIVHVWRFSRSNGITEGFHTTRRCSRAGPMGSEILRITACGFWHNAVGMQ